MKENVIELKNVRKEFVTTKHYPGFKGAVKGLFTKEKMRKIAVDDVSFEIKKGEIVGYIGSNGAGKSTTIKMMSGILTPTSGSCLVNGLEPYKERKEMERLGVDLSWKSSQIEGNTYNLLETERLLLEKEEAKGKTKEEAIMLLNHKEALDFILDNPDYLQYLSIRKIEDIHSILIKELGVERHIRSRRVGITGTNYRPLDNEYQIREAMEDTCQLINNKQSIFDKAFLALVLLSYIQPFADGNKRTARITSNAILIANGYCPLSFRSVDSIDYKKAMLVFYEQNNIYPFKKIFIEQFEFAVNTYF